MTTAKPQLLLARRLLIDNLDVHPDRTVNADLDPAEVGIVGNPAHIGGYHCGKDRVRRTNGTIRDYSVNESPRDRAGLNSHASAVDVGWFDITVHGRRHTLRTFSAWLVTQCKAGAADTRDIREIIYSLDGVVVRRWDRLGRRSNGDDSHRSHTHVSEFRDADGTNMVRLFRRYLTDIGLLVGLLAGEDSNDMDLDDVVRPDLTVRNVFASVYDRTGTIKGGEIGKILAGLAALRVDLATFAGRDPVNEAELAGLLWQSLPQHGMDTVERVLRAGMSPEDLAELATRLTGPAPS